MSLLLRNITHRFGKITVVSDACLEAAAGEIVCLVGPSGCGKTTLLRVAAGLDRLQEGEVALHGARLAAPGIHTPPEKRPVGFVFQDYVLFPHLTVRDNIAFGLAGDKNAKARIAEQLRAFDLGDLAARYPHELSGGQQQRTALARALARRPQALLLDEPFASIDAALRHRLREEMRLALKEQNVTVLLVTHDAEEALALGDRVALMRAGRIVECAAPEDLFDRPATADGAKLFRGSQTIEGAIRNERMKTPLGEFAAPGLDDGPGVVVLRRGALVATPDGEGNARVADTRFSGPGWAVYMEVEGLRAPVCVTMNAPLPLGTRAHIAVESRRAFVFSDQ